MGQREGVYLYCGGGLEQAECPTYIEGDLGEDIQMWGKTYAVE